eukprot:CAMPEP_0206141132 /NCGR_PEP_ID=MMETSP1473-20131121/11870_1 /ASSEMBLY_ACC=CAM_ASM_001109 /TAXON_ID=1461547 /ORGANISM="Stichococcus sp, Strain RCC1054" /LENGTH=159 /DNA_ID=CAMNT_0053535553 /DNA_START=177 /DNA_END=652 /DNA_ORIENTATION=-
MSFVSKLFGGLLGRSDEAVGDPAAPPVHPLPQQPLPVIFNERDATEGRLARLWSDCQASEGCGQAEKQALHQFFEAFNAAFESWQPQAPPAPNPVQATASAPGSRIGRWSASGGLSERIAQSRLGGQQSLRRSSAEGVQAAVQSAPERPPPMGAVPGQG